MIALLTGSLGYDDPQLPLIVIDELHRQLDGEILTVLIRDDGVGRIVRELAEDHWPALEVRHFVGFHLPLDRVIAFYQSDLDNSFIDTLCAAAAFRGVLVTRHFDTSGISR